MRAITLAATALSGIWVGDADGDGFPAIVSLHQPASRLSQRRRSGHRMDIKPRSVGAWMLVIAVPFLGGCATKAGYSDLAYEQDRCAGYWRSTGDADRASEMNRRATESRRAGGNVGA